MSTVSIFVFRHGQSTFNRDNRLTGFHNPTVSITAGQEKIIGPFDPRYFTDSSGFLNLSYSAVTSVTVAVIQKN
jgi:hypothetical protein